MPRVRDSPFSLRVSSWHGLWIKISPGAPFSFSSRATTIYGILLWPLPFSFWLQLTFSRPPPGSTGRRVTWSKVLFQIFFCFFFRFNSIPRATRAARTFQKMSGCFRLVKRFRTRYAADACPTVSRRWRAIDIVQLSLHWSSAASNFRPRTAHSKPHLGLSFAKSADRTTRVLWNWNSWIYVSSERSQNGRPSEIRATLFHSSRCPICAQKLKGQTEQLWPTQWNYFQWNWFIF